MNIKFNKQKQELREDPVVDWLFATKEFIQKNLNGIIGTLVAVIVILGVFFAFNYYRKSHMKSAREEFGKAMVLYNDQKADEAVDQFRMVAENYRGTSVGTMSAYMLGSILYRLRRYDEAITWYEKVKKGKDVGFIKPQALEGLAACYEIKADTTSAIKCLEAALADERLSYRRNAIKWKIALLSRTNNAERAKKMCDEIIADTTAQEYHQDAEFLKAFIINSQAG